MNVDLLIKENQELNKEKQRYKDMWFTANNSLAKYRKLEEQLGCPLEVYVKLHQQKKFYRLNALNEIIECEIDNPNDEEVYHIQTDGIIFNQYDYGWQFYPFKDYKKTWWLKADKSE